MNSNLRCVIFAFLLGAVIATSDEIEDCPELEIMNTAYPSHLVKYPANFGLPSIPDVHYIDIILAMIPPEYYPYILEGKTYPFGLYTGPDTVCNLLPGIPEKFYSLLRWSIVIDDLKRRLEYLDRTDQLNYLVQVAELVQDSTSA